MIENRNVPGIVLRTCKMHLELFFGLPVSTFDRGGNCVAWLSATVSIQCNPLSFQRAVSALVIQQVIRMWDASQRESMSSALEFL